MFEYGQWTEEVSEGKSSNWRELANLVHFLQAKGKAGELDDVELFMFTDNSTAEAAFWKGTSKSELLLGLVLYIDLRELEMETGLMLHILHVSGKRMIAQGTDGLSRGDHSSGVMAGTNMLHYVPLHLSALSRSPPLLSWLEDVLCQSSPTFLTPENWYEPTRGNSTFVWTPPPAAADVVVERLRVSRHMRPNSFHIVLVPRLMTGRWRKQLGRASDVYFRLDVSSFWDLADQFEPLLMCLCLPFLPHRPRFSERQSLCQKFRELLQLEVVHDADTSWKRNILRQLFSQALSLSTL
jgi:hypothetical protein